MPTSLSSETRTSEDMKVNYSPVAHLCSRRFVLTPSVALNDMGVVFRPQSALQQQG